MNSHAGIGEPKTFDMPSIRLLFKRRTKILKRTVDVLGSLSGLVIFAIPMGIISVVVKVKMGSPIIFRQERPGQYGVPFTMYKFRTMTNERDNSGVLLEDRRRMSKFGIWLRSTSMDELPELLNVLKGDMSLVGPRPLLSKYTHFYSDREATRLYVRPGITGLAQISGRNSASWGKRLQLDVQYVESLSLGLDLRILRTTFGKVLRRADIESDPQSVMMNLDEERIEWLQKNDN